MRLSLKKIILVCKHLSDGFQPQLSEMWSTSNAIPNYSKGWALSTPKAQVTSYEHGGATPGVATFILTRTDGWSAALFFNRNLSSDFSSIIHEELNKIDDVTANSLPDLTRIRM